MPHLVAFLMLPAWYCVFYNSSRTSSSFNHSAKRLSLAAIVSRGKIFELLFKLKLTRTLTIFGAHGILALVKYTIMSKPIKSLQYPMIQFLINKYIYIYIYIALWCKNQIEHSIWDESLLFSNCARSLEYSSSSTLAGLSYHICGKLEVTFKGSPSSQHQHCTDEAQKAETVL